MAARKKSAIESRQGHPEGLIDDAAKAAAKAAAKLLKKSNPKNSYKLGKTVVHGSPVSGLKKIDPRKGSLARPNDSVVFGWNPKFFRHNIEDIAGHGSSYAKGGSLYVGKVPRGGIEKGEHAGIIVSKKPIKVKKEIKYSEGNVGNKLNKSIRGKSKRNIVNKVQKSKRAAQYKRSSRNSPV